MNDKTHNKTCKSFSRMCSHIILKQNAVFSGLSGLTGFSVKLAGRANTILTTLNLLSFNHGQAGSLHSNTMTIGQIISSNFAASASMDLSLASPYQKINNMASKSNKFISFQLIR